MTALCRPLLVSMLALMLPACLQLDTPNAFPSNPVPSDPTSSPTPVEAKTSTHFAEMVSRPGMVVPLKPATTAPVVSPPTAETQTVAIQPTPPPETLPSEVTTSLPELPLVAAVRAYAENHPDRAIEFLSSLGKANQEFVLTVLPALWQGATQDMGADPNAAAVLAEQLRAAAARIETAAALRVDAVTFCQAVDGFGMYNPRPKGLPYKGNELAWLYLEVRNMACLPAGPNSDLYLIRYQATVEIRDSYDKLVDQNDPKNLRGRKVGVVEIKAERSTRTPVHEFYLLYKSNVPTAPGVYNISVMIEDLATHRRVKTEPVQFTVAGP